MRLQDILAKTPCEVHTFDPTLSPEQKKSVEKVPGIMFHDYGLGAEDGVEPIGTVKSLPSILKVQFPHASRSAVV